MATSAGGIRVNVGCGSSLTPGYVNLDNSMSVRLASLPVVRTILTQAPFVTGPRRKFLTAASSGDIRWADATSLPFADGEVSVVYSSHMMEHLTREEARAFLKEALRVLRPGGWLRLVLPDLRRRAESYVSGAVDADSFVDSLIMATPRPASLVDRMTFVFTGPRHHLWMYDGPSLIAALHNAGFSRVTEVAPGQTNLEDPGPLDLAERAEESVYVEAQKALNGA